MKLNFLLSVLILSCSASIAQNVNSASLSKQNDPKMEWWKAAKFGMFIHWGIYSVPAGKWGEKPTYGEWVMHSAKIPRAEYSALAKEFNPTRFNADEGVKPAKDAGQKYIVTESCG